VAASAVTQEEETAGAGADGWQYPGQCVSNLQLIRLSSVYRFAAAAGEDCTAALAFCQPDLRHKVGGAHM
jgi:hypothetical protein